MGLTQYRKMRDFKKTAEPSGSKAARAAKAAGKSAGKSASAKKSKSASAANVRSFVIQKHDASHLHYDFRLELGGVLKSWAVPKGPSLDPSVKRLAMEVEDHPLDYATFEGSIPEGEYGGGDVIVWDRGDWISSKSPEADIKKGRLEFELKGEKLSGKWILVRTGRPSKKPQWLLMKRTDEAARATSKFDVTEEMPESVKTGEYLPRDQTGAKSGARPGAKAKATAPKSISRKAATAKTAVTSKTLKKTAPAKKTKTTSKKKSEKFPGFIKPQLAKLSEVAPGGGDWVHEIKFDGYRAVTTFDSGEVKMFTRSGLDWTAKYQPVADDLSKLKIENAIFDGEVVWVDEHGRSDFSGLQAALKSGKDEELVYFAFDLLWLDGEDLRERPLLERKELLEKVIAKAKSDRFRYSEHWIEEGASVLKASCGLNMEGIISKRLDSTYESTRSGTWVKTKCVKGQEFVIGGFTEPQGSRYGFGALLLGAKDQDGELRYVGRVGTGFSQKTLAELKTLFKKRIVKKSPFEVASPTGKEITFIKPDLVAQVGFTEWTSDLILRHPTFQGLRGDKKASQVVIEDLGMSHGSRADDDGDGDADTDAAEVAEPSAELKSEMKSEMEPGAKATTTKKVAARKGKKAASAAKVKAASAKSKSGAKSSAKSKSKGRHPGLSHPDKLLYPKAGYSKDRVATYYDNVAEFMMPHLKDRPIAMVRCPEGEGGECFFQKKLGFHKGVALKTAKVTGQKNKKEELVYTESAAGLTELVQMGVLEIHVWGTEVQDLMRPNLIVFDLDPEESVSFDVVKKTAVSIRDLLADMNLKSFVSTTGGKGLHIRVPIVPEHDYDQIKAFSLAVVRHLEKLHPDLYTTQILKSKRNGRIFLDYLRNGYGATAIVPYSLRNKPKATASVPLDWKELRSLKSADAFTLVDVERRLARGKDPWLGYFKLRQRLRLK